MHLAKKEKNITSKLFLLSRHFNRQLQFDHQSVNNGKLNGAWGYSKCSIIGRSGFFQARRGLRSQIDSLWKPTCCKPKLYALDYKEYLCDECVSMNSELHKAMSFS